MTISKAEKQKKYPFLVFWFGKAPSLVCQEGYYIHGESDLMDEFKEEAKKYQPEYDFFMVSYHYKSDHAFTRAEVERMEHVRKHKRKSSAKVANIRHYLEYMRE